MAAGSHTTYGGWEPKTCHICGAKIVKSRDTQLEAHGHRFHYDHTTNTATSTHVHCERQHRKEAT